MKAVVIHAAHDLRVEDREPETPGPGQVEVAIEAGGICGSDLHYFNHGGFGTVRIREPMILGHEIAGTIKATGPGASKFSVGDQWRFPGAGPAKRVSIVCRVWAFRQRLVAEDWQCHDINDGISINEAAFAEPFAVTLHAVARAGSLLGKRVIVTGCGPIGALTIIAARVLDCYEQGRAHRMPNTIFISYSQGMLEAFRKRLENGRYSQPIYHLDRSTDHSRRPVGP